MLADISMRILEDTNPSEFLWIPRLPESENTLIVQFMKFLAINDSFSFKNYEELHSWSVNNSESFWSKCWDFFCVVGEKGEKLSESLDRMIDAKFFPASRFNLAENCLQRRDGSPAIIFTQENALDRVISWEALYASVWRVARKMRLHGIRKGDRVCAVISNVPEAVICMLATASIGAIWSSVSPDFGAEGILERFGQIAPRMLFYSAWYKNKNRTYDVCERIREVERGLGSGVISVCVTDGGLDVFCGDQGGATTDTIEFEATNFNDPMFIMFSSGTTGKPKCLIHRHGVLLQLMKEHQLHSDIRPDDKVFYYTTTTWMMWHWLVGSLASKATILLYEGNPFYPTCNSLFEFASRAECSFFGVSAKFIDGLRGDPSFITPNIPKVRMIASTGSPLLPEAFDFVYARIKKDVILASICGGTDIVSCFILGCPIKPVKRGFAQSRGLGMDVRVWSTEKEELINEQGELVCCSPFVSQPIGFWGDEANTLYGKTYFEDFPGVWKHGDFVLLDQEGYMRVYGRSDATMKPGGVRIGTAEIYRAVESLPFIREAICCGVTQEEGGDEVVALFVTLRDPEAVLSENMREDIKKSVNRYATRHHVPKIIEQVHDIPRTKNGKIVELAVKNVLHKKPVASLHALANPEALSEFARFEFIKSKTEL